jgi:hypothetical protein
MAERRQRPVARSTGTQASVLARLTTARKRTRSLTSAWIEVDTKYTTPLYSAASKSFQGTIVVANKNKTNAL